MVSVESLMIFYGLVNLTMGLVVGWCAGFVMGSRKKGDYTK